MRLTQVFDFPSWGKRDAGFPQFWEFSSTKIGGSIPLLSGHSRLRAEAENQVCKRASVSGQAKANLISTGQTLVL